MPLDVFQQVFALSLASEIVNDLKGPQTSLQEVLQRELTSTLPIIAAEWQLVWGPVVLKYATPDDPSTGADNAWFVAFHPSLEFEDGSVHPTYVIAVAGTPPGVQNQWEAHQSSPDTVVDFKVWVTQGIQTAPVVVPVKDIVPGVSYINGSVANVVYLLVTTATPDDAISPGTTLIDFLTNVDRSASPRFISTGHSLGGILSPSLALSLVSANVIPTGSTLSYGIAGLSPGNTTFRDLFKQIFPPLKSEGARSYQGWNFNLVNTLDIVPQVWCTSKDISKEQNMSNIPLIYGKPAPPLVSGTTELFARHAATAVQYAPLASQYFIGPRPPTTPSSLGEFVEITLRQHIQAYLDAVGVTLPTKFKLPSSVTEKSEIETRFNYPVIAGYEWAREHPKEAEEIIEQEIGPGNV